MTFYWYRDRDEEYRQYFTLDQERSLVYSSDAGGLVKALVIQYVATEWRLFFDSSVKSMKAVLLHIGNKLASVPVAHSVESNEYYVGMKHLL